MYGGLNHGRIEVDGLRAVLAGLSLPRFEGGRLVLAVDVSPWLRSDAPCSAELLFCHVYGRAKTVSQFIPGWPYSLVAVLEPGATSWTAILGAVRLGPADDATAIAAARERGARAIGGHRHRVVPHRSIGVLRSHRHRPHTMRTLRTAHRRSPAPVPTAPLRPAQAARCPALSSAQDDPAHSQDRPRCCATTRG
ncbi:hypothetical protein SHO565_70540 [Streptomyces sp. HO565]